MYERIWYCLPHKVQRIIRALIIMIMMRKKILVIINVCLGNIYLIALLCPHSQVRIPCMFTKTYVTWQILSFLPSSLTEALTSIKHSTFQLNWFEFSWKHLCLFGLIYFYMQLPKPAALISILLPLLGSLLTPSTSTWMAFLPNFSIPH
jgi:hypothetical protein